MKTPQGVSGLFHSLEVNQRNKFCRPAIYMTEYGVCECARVSETIFLQADQNYKSKWRET